MKFPTGKTHVSFSEVKEHQECPHKHWLKHVKKISVFEPTVHTEFGTALHAACEEYLKTGEMNIDIALDMIHDSWNEHGLPEKVQVYDAKTKSFIDDPKGDTYPKAAKRVLDDVPMFMDLVFPNWEPVKAEEKLYELMPFVSVPGMHFKGYVDAIIRVPDKFGDYTYWILDWKTCHKAWKKWKRDNELLKLQPVYYNEFYLAKKKLKRSQVRTGFATLIYGAEHKKARIELIEVQPTTQRRVKALRVLQGMVSGVAEGKHEKVYKNDYGSNCTFCDYRESEWCDGT